MLNRKSPHLIKSLGRKYLLLRSLTGLCEVLHIVPLFKSEKPENTQVWRGVLGQRGYGIRIVDAMVDQEYDSALDAQTPIIENMVVGVPPVFEGLTRQLDKIVEQPLLGPRSDFPKGRAPLLHHVQSYKY